MSINGSDNRFVVTGAGLDSLGYVVAVDRITINPDTLPRVAGALSFVNEDNNSVTAAAIEDFIYRDIINEIGRVDGKNNGNDLPENAIIGRNDSSLRDAIEGTYRRERILGLDGDDFLEGMEGDDRLEGGKGNDKLDGGKDEDKAIFSDTFENCNIETTGFFNKITTVAHKNGGTDGVDTLENIEFGIFAGEEVPLSANSGAATTNSNSAATTERIIPLPLEDGVEKTEVVEIAHTLASPNPNDPPTPPYISLTAPVDMLDGDIEYTIDISPYKPDTQHNVAYIIDTSASMYATKLQNTKDAYTNLTNYFIDQDIADSINFSVISFNEETSTLESDLTASSAISAIEDLEKLTPTRISSGNVYDDALIKAKQFFNHSSFNSQNSTNIAYFATDGKSGKSSQFNYNTYRPYASSLRNSAHVRAFGINDDPHHTSAVVQSQMNFVDSNDALLVDDASDLSSELLKSDLADDVESVNIMLDHARRRNSPNPHPRLIYRQPIRSYLRRNSRKPRRN